ncbi:MAG: phosphate signaling complex protein PhoU [Gallionellaceae bacterium]
MKIPEHTSNTFDAELTTACEKVMRMAELVENQFSVAISSLASADLAAMDSVMDMGYLVNAMEIEIDELCTSILVRRQPTANDLRLVTTIIKIINDLERVGDEAENVVKYSRLIFQKNLQQLPCYSQINYISDVAGKMLSAAMSAFEEMDAEIAREMAHKDALIDQECRSILRGLIGYMMEDGSDLTVAMQVGLISRSVERIGDHAKNISEYVVYMIQGRRAQNYCTI